MSESSLFTDSAHREWSRPNALPAILPLMLDFGAFAAPAVSFIQLKVVGVLFGTDLVLLGLFPVLLISRWNLLTDRPTVWFFGMGTLWLFSQIATDFVRGIPFDDYARGWSMIILFLLHFATLFMLLYRSRRRIVLFAIGTVVGGLLTYFISPDVLAAKESWKFGYGTPISEVVILVSTAIFAIGWQMLGALILLATVGLNLFNGYRALAGMIFMSAVFLVASKRGHRMGESTWRATLSLWIVIAVAVLALFRSYSYMASTGVISEHEREKYDYESSGEMGMLLGGRGEIFSSALAIWDSPLIGHGSWAKDMRYAFEGQAIMTALGYNRSEGLLALNVAQTDGGIPSHSYLFGAWVDAGLMGGIFWLWIFAKSLRALSVLYSLRECLKPWIAYIIFSLLWAIPFSPFGASSRFQVAYEVVLLMFVIESAGASVSIGDVPHFRQSVEL